ncbi:MAG: type VI secretion system ATPase TssH, partial [Firmicutes bacterium]|nr:type VI secretion system ATPase TssH [Bacillota bacterium]
PYILEGIENGEISEEARAQVDSLLKQHFRPEFLNRLDEIVYYKPLAKDEIGAIVDLMLADLNKRLKNKQLSAEVSESAKNYIIENGYDPVYGARPLKRYIQAHVETLVGRMIIKENLEPETVIKIDTDENGLVCKV